MDLPAIPLQDSPSSTNDPSDEMRVELSLYIARSTPNSVRAEQNLKAVLKGLSAHSARIALEVIDVFTEPRRALNDGIVVTPAFVAVSSSRRSVLIGDLSDRTHLHNFIQELIDR